MRLPILGLLLSLTTACSLVLAKSPVVLVPGIAGSQLWGVDKSSRRTQIWVSVEEIYLWRDLAEKLKLDYDVNHRVPFDSHAYIVEPGHYGESRGIEYLDDSLSFAGRYMHYLVDRLVKSDEFYQRNQTIRGAPYDFRFTPREKPEMRDKLKALIEETYELAGQKPVTLLGHSLGGPNAVIFLNQMTQTWRAKYIKQFFSVAGVYGGSVKSIKCQVSGDSVNLPFLSESTLRPLLRSMSGISALLPHPDLFGDQVLVLTDQKNYTAKEYEALFKAAETVNSFYMWQDNEAMYRDMTKPPSDVKTVCVYGSSIPTMQQLDYRRNRFPDYQPKTVYGPGDGTVSKISLELCRQWHKVEVHELSQAEHFDVISDPRLISILQDSL